MRIKAYGNNCLISNKQIICHEVNKIIVQYHVIMRCEYLEICLIYLFVKYFEILVHRYLYDHNIYTQTIQINPNRKSF